MKPLVEVVDADLQVTTISGKSNVQGDFLHTDLAIEVQNNGDDAATGITLIVTFPATTYHVSSMPAGQLVVAVPPAVDPNVPPGSNVIGATIIELADLSVRAKTSVSVSFEMAAAARTIGGGVRVGAFVYGSRPDSNGSNNASSYSV